MTLFQTLITIFGLMTGARRINADPITCPGFTPEPGFGNLLDPQFLFIGDNHVMFEQMLACVKIFDPDILLREGVPHSIDPIPCGMYQKSVKQSTQCQGWDDFDHVQAMNKNNTQEQAIIYLKNFFETHQTHVHEFDQALDVEIEKYTALKENLEKKFPVKSANKKHPVHFAEVGVYYRTIVKYLNKLYDVDAKRKNGLTPKEIAVSYQADFSKPKTLLFETQYDANSPDFIKVMETRSEALLTSLKKQAEQKNKKVAVIIGADQISNSKIINSTATGKVVRHTQQEIKKLLGDNRFAILASDFHDMNGKTPPNITKLRVRKA